MHRPGAVHYDRQRISSIHLPLLLSGGCQPVIYKSIFVQRENCEDLKDSSQNLKRGLSKLLLSIWMAEGYECQGWSPFFLNISGWYGNGSSVIWLLVSVPGIDSKMHVLDSSFTIWLENRICLQDNLSCSLKQASVFLVPESNRQREKCPS